MMTIKPFLFKKLLAVLAPVSAILSIGAATADAREIIAHQNLGSSPDVYRIEVRDLKEFRVTDPGDQDGIGELHKFEVLLKWRDQKHGYIEDYNSFMNKTTGQKGNSAFVEARTGDTLKFGGRTARTNTNRNLWIHAPRHGRNSVTNVVLIISTTELDCSLEKVCERQDVGKYWVSFSIPRWPISPDLKCGPNNSYQLDIDRGVLRNIAGLDNISIDVGVSSNAPHLRPSGAVICIASTKERVIEWAKPDQYFNDPSSATYPKMQFIRNVQNRQCIGLAWTPEEIVATETCKFDAPEGVDADQKWRIMRYRLDAGANWSIRNSGDTKCLNLKSSEDNYAGGKVRPAGCSLHPDQQWMLKRLNSGFYQIRNFATNKCLSMFPEGASEWGRVAVYPCDDSRAQQWETISEESAIYYHNNPETRNAR